MNVLIDTNVLLSASVAEYGRGWMRSVDQGQLAFQFFGRPAFFANTDLRSSSLVKFRPATSADCLGRRPLRERRTASGPAWGKEVAPDRFVDLSGEEVNQLDRQACAPAG
jgi:hypothetical protein